MAMMDAQNEWGGKKNQSLKDIILINYTAVLIRLLHYAAFNFTRESG